MLFSVEQAFVGREEIRAPLKTPAWEATRKAMRRNILRRLIPLAMLFPLKSRVTTRTKDNLTPNLSQLIVM